jgi:ABC-type Fe3+-hydroxamate transport system substrate-binding protein
VLLLAWEEPPIVIGSGSFQDELVTLAGAVNVFADLALPSAQVTVEAIAARDPDLIVLLDADGMPAWSERPEWQVVRAVRERRFLPVRGTAFARPTLRALEAVRTLQDAFAATPP